MTPPVVRLTRALMSCWLCFQTGSDGCEGQGKPRCWVAANEIMWQIVM